jgi:hypothetical protein
MTITERMIEAKDKLVDIERDKALIALTEMIHNRIAPRVAGGTVTPYSTTNPK